MRYFNRLSLLLAAFLVFHPGWHAAAAQDIRDLHRELAREMLKSVQDGAVLRGKVEQNGSPGEFEAYFHDGNYLIRETFGGLVSMSYRGPEGAYSGGNYILPYRIEPTDSPASTAVGMLSSGAYLEDENWDAFTYVGEEAGGYRFRFSPADLPSVDVLLYSDDDDPEYLQIMSTEVRLAPLDEESISHRSYYYYAQDEGGKLYTQRETGRELDHRGLTVNQSEYTVTEFDALSDRPAELQFDVARSPVGGAGAGLSGPVEVPIDTSRGYFVVPITFQDGATLNFILDTGASASLFAPNAVAASGIETSVVTTAHGHGTRQVFELGMVTGASIGTSNGAQVPLMPFPAMKIPTTNRDVLEAMESYGCAGILGVAPFHQYVITLDHNGQKLTCHPQQVFNASELLGGKALVYSLDAEDLIYVKARINETVTGQMALDTGLQQDFALLKETMQLSGLAFEKVGASVNTVIGGKLDVDYVSVPSFELGPLRLEGKVAAMSEDDRGSLVARRVLGFIGLQLFRQARITIDLFEQRMYIEPPAELLEQMQQSVPALFDGVVDDRYVTIPGSSSRPVPFGATPPAAAAEPADDDSRATLTMETAQS